MKLNKEKLQQLAALNDAQLWKEIYSAAQKFGYTLPEKTPDANTMAKIRGIMKEGDKISAMELARLMSTLKAKRNKE